MRSWQRDQQPEYTLTSLPTCPTNRDHLTHLTQWQARFRQWYDHELKKYETAGNETVLEPQQIQAKFPQYGALKDDMERVNKALMQYRAKMYELVLK